MALSSPPVCNFGWEAPSFSLPATNGNTYRLQDLTGSKGTLIMFICNHCPYVLAVLERIKRDAVDLQALGIGVAAICSNDPDAYPADNFPAMQAMAAKEGFSFPYLHDESQTVARAYDAVCTPDFFGFDGKLGLQYRGRLDASGARPGSEDTPRELFEALRQVAETGNGPENQVPSMGCSIKWKTA